MRLDQELVYAEQVKRLVGDEDPQLLIDMIEGETRLLEAVDALHKSMLEDAAIEAGAKAMAEQMSSRASAAKRRSEKKRMAIQGAMTKLNLTSLKRPTATFSVRAKPAKVEVYDESAVPSQLFRIKKEVDKAAIRKALEQGEEIPGCELVDGEMTLSVRT